MTTVSKATDFNAFLDVLDVEPRPLATQPQGIRNSYATRFANRLAVLFANSLRSTFEGILPRPDGSGQESRARTAKGYKKLDVNYSTPELGLGLGVSLKHIGYRDAKTKRYTKNYTRNDNELRAEAMDYHERQPYAVMIGVLFLPYDACDDCSGKKDPSSFGAAVKHFRNRAGRSAVDAPPDLFEKFYIALYEHSGEKRGSLDFYDVDRPKPPFGRRPYPDEVLSFEQFVEDVIEVYDSRNAPPFEWAV
ncbi:hypothetical protein ACIG3E_08355 [Streptomyces sp. NPDC053474]|uniref:hypothetical protein n=1 Tax=Streptomyces sp. NPDC053474 TaxID=3365704 RepID=UPI0037CF3815